jgi:uncharacterized protein
VRYPSWVADGALRIVVNGKTIASHAHPLSYVGIDRQWVAGDTIEVFLPMHNTVEYLPHVSRYIAFMHGPILLAARSGTEDLAGLVADDSRWGHIASGKRLPLDKAPVLIADSIEKIAGMLAPVEGKPLTFSLAHVEMLNPVNVVLEPFYQIHDTRYMMYWAVQHVEKQRPVR